MTTDKKVILKEKDVQKSDKEKRREEFLKTVECKIKKSEKDIWYIHDLEHVFDKNR